MVVSEIDKFIWKNKHGSRARKVRQYGEGPEGRGARRGGSCSILCNVIKTQSFNRMIQVWTLRKNSVQVNSSAFRIPAQRLPLVKSLSSEDTLQSKHTITSSSPL